jgi:hypothetical protein
MNLRTKFGLRRVGPLGKCDKPTVASSLGARTLKKFACFGNCQSSAIAEVLSDHEPFTSRFEIIPLKPVYLMTPDDLANTKQSMETFDLFLSQDVSECYAPADARGLIEAMRPDADALLFPVGWFDAYSPDVSYLRDEKGQPIASWGCDYHSKIVLDAYVAGRSVVQATELLVADVDPDVTNTNLAKNLRELRIREAGLDIGISDEIEKTFQDRPIFYTYNHPSADMHFYVIDEMMKKIGLPLLATSIREKWSGLLSGVQWFINPSIADALKLKFRTNPYFSIGAAKFSPEAFVETAFSFYFALDFAGT